MEQLNENMKNWLGALFLAVLMCVSTSPAFSAPLDLNGCAAHTAFSPHGEGLSLILDTISSAKKEIRMSTYSFTEPNIGKALLDAHKRGVDVKIVVDKEHNGRREADAPSVSRFLASNGVSVSLTKAYKIQHNKVLIVDRQTVQTGSFNFSRAAQKDNAENVLVISRCPKLAAAYLNDWNKLADSARYKVE